MASLGVALGDELTAGRGVVVGGETVGDGVDFGGVGGGVGRGGEAR